TILVGLDGVGRLLHTVARRSPETQAEEGSLGYLAPEVHGGDPYDGRADVFSVGVLLWEVLEGQSLTDSPEGLPGLRVRSGEIPAPSAPEKAPWAKALVPIATRALAAAPEDRWATAAGMAAEIRKAAGLKLAPASAATAYAKTKFGERVKARRARLEATPPAPAESALQVRVAGGHDAGPDSAPTVPRAPVHEEDSHALDLLDSLDPPTGRMDAPPPSGPTAIEIPVSELSPAVELPRSLDVSAAFSNLQMPAPAAAGREASLPRSLDVSAAFNTLQMPPAPVAGPEASLPRSMDVSAAFENLQIGPGSEPPLGPPEGSGTDDAPTVPAHSFAPPPGPNAGADAFAATIPGGTPSPFGSPFAAPPAAAPTPPAETPTEEVFASPVQMPERGRKRTFAVLGGVVGLG